jgi:hypothetical protein
MTREATIELPWPDEMRKYRLGLGELRELQEKCGDRIAMRERGPMEILDDLQTRKWRADDIFQIVRLGLIGAGLEAHKALALANTYASPPRLSEAILFATVILQAAIVGPPEDLIRVPDSLSGKDKALKTGGSASAKSTGKEPSSVSRRKKSTA